MKDEKRLKTSNQNEKKETENIDYSQILQTPILTPKKQRSSTGYFCTIRQFAYFLEAKEYQKKTIVKQMASDEEPDHPFWFQTAYSSIATSLEKGDLTPIYDGIAKLKQSNPSGSQGKHNKKLSIEALEKYLKLYLPFNYRGLKKVKVEAKEITTKTYNFFDIEIKPTPDFIFRTELNGKKVLGGIRVNIKSGEPLNDLRMKVVSFLLFKYLEKHVAKNGEIVLPEFCICIDVFKEKCVSAPYGTNVPHIALKNTAEEYKNRWNKL